MKFKLGDKVRAKTFKIITETITCPFCDGKGHIVKNGMKCECYSCEYGKYELEKKVKFWGIEREVIGSVKRKKFMNDKETKEFICVTGPTYRYHSVDCYPEDELEFADKVNKGDPYENNSQ